MKIRLTTDIEVTKTTTFLRNSERIVSFMKDGLWMRGMQRRPLADHEWELILNDAELQRQFPQVPRKQKNKEE